MRTSAPGLLPIFRSQMQVELLGLLILQPGREWTLDEISRQLRATRSSVHRELTRAVDAGLVRRNEAQRPHRYRAAEDSPVYRALRELLERTVGVEERLKDVLSKHDAVQAAAIHGSWANGRVRPNSDIDVLVIADDDHLGIQRAIRNAGRKIGRGVDVSVLTSHDFKQLVGEANPFLRAIVRGPRIDLIGDLAALAASE